VREKAGFYAEAKTNTAVCAVVNLLLVVLKFAAGFWGRSSALVADGLHSLSDLLTDLAVFIGLRFSEQPADECHNYGHEKYETLVTALIGIFLFIAGYEVLKAGVAKIIQIARGTIPPGPSHIALAVALLSIIAKEILYRYSAAVGRRLNLPSVTANAWHHRSDAFSSIGVFIGIGGSILLGEKWLVLDPLASVVVSLFIFQVAYRVIVPSIHELTDAAVSEEQKKKITDIIHSCAKVKAFHKLRTRKIGNKVIIDMHILVDKEIDLISAHNIASSLEEELKQVFNTSAIITIHVEPDVTA
jgi:cation diffusion facilitator family transporter